MGEAKVSTRHYEIYKDAWNGNDYIYVNGFVEKMEIHGLSRIERQVQGG